MADIFDKMVDGINKGAASISEGSKTLMEKARINSAINDLTDQKNKLCELMGQQAYNLYLSGFALPDELLKFCVEMQKRDAAISENKAKLAALDTPKEVVMPKVTIPPKVCSCGCANKPVASFCVKCGKAI